MSLPLSNLSKRVLYRMEWVPCLLCPVSSGHPSEEYAMGSKQPVPKWKETRACLIVSTHQTTTFPSRMQSWLSSDISLLSWQLWLLSLATKMSLSPSQGYTLITPIVIQFLYSCEFLTAAFMEHWSQLKLKISVCALLTTHSLQLWLTVTAGWLVIGKWPHQQTKTNQGKPEAPGTLLNCDFLGPLSGTQAIISHSSLNFFQEAPNLLVGFRERELCHEGRPGWRVPKTATEHNTLNNSLSLYMNFCCFVYWDKVTVCSLGQP